MSINRLIQRTNETLKNEGLKSFSKKAVNYVKLRVKNNNKVIFGDVLIINGCTLSHPKRYRVDHQQEQLQSSGLITDKINYEKLSLDMIKHYRCFIFFRCPITSVVEEFIKEAKSENKVVFFDIDDLVIDKKYTDQIKYLKTMSETDKALYDDGVNRMQKTLKMCDYAITTTERLAQELKKYVSEVYINRNVASERMAELSLMAIKNKVVHDDIVIGYLSGSITHNDDFEMIKPVLIDILKNNKRVKLKLIGELSIPEELAEFSEQIITSPFVSWELLPDVIASIDINLAPLEDTIFNEAKSENKWLEAALVKTVTIASNVGAFKKNIKDGKNGLLCSSIEDWKNKLGKLINDETYREKLAEEAYKEVIHDRITVYSGHGLAKFIRSKLHRNIAFVLPTTNISGGVNVVIKHISILKKQGYDVCIINMDNNDKDVMTKFGVIKVIKLNNTKIYGYFDTLVATLWSTLKPIKKYSNVKNRLYLVQNYETDFANFGKYMRIDANATYEDQTNIKYITISKWCQNWLDDKFEKQTRYAPNGIDLKQFPFKQRNFSNKVKILVEGNSDDYYKNVDESFKIVSKLDKSKYEIHFLSYQGEPKKWYYVDKFMHKIPYEEVGKVYQDADILIKSSILESFSYPPLEMMATGGLVVVAPNGGNVEYIKDRENCLFYEPGNIDDAVYKIEELVNNKDLRDKLIDNGLKTAKNRSWEKIEKQIINLYEVDNVK